MEPHKKTINVDFDQIREIAQRGVRRAAVFMGLGLNAAYEKDFKDYRLSKITKVELVGSGASDEQIERFKKDFSYWIIGNGLREMTETFNIFLDRLHNACLVLKLVKVGSLSIHEAKAAAKKFHRGGLSDKLVTLKKEFGIEPNNFAYLISINKARNCLTHRRGIVGEPDVGEDRELHLKWRGIEVFIKTPAGEEIPLLPGGIMQPVELHDGGDVMMRFPERAKTFSLGEQLIFTPSELTELCHLVLEETDAINAGGIAFAKKLGIPMQKEIPES
jgi:hypothetical protein